MSIKNNRGYSLPELIVGLMLTALAIALIVPSGTTTKDNTTTKAAAEELVARFRQARQTAITKAIPVAVAFPVAPPLHHSDQAYILEGEVNPKVTEEWKIQQREQEIVYFTGTWTGPTTWGSAPVLETTSKNFQPSAWFGSATPPSATLIIFTPSGNAISESPAADGKYRVVVAMGVSSGGSSSLVSANSPHTVWISPSGEVGLEKGVYQGTVFETKDKNSAPVASFVLPTRPANSPPVVQAIAPSTKPGPRAFPNTQNPKTGNGNIIDLDAVLTLEVRVKDVDGDPPYFQWVTTAADEVSSNGTTFSAQSDMSIWGGRFGNSKEVRMEWDPDTQEWVGRDTWSPSTRDKGGNRYKLQCRINDRNGGKITTGFPVDGNYLATTKEPWILYKTWNASNRSELWKMTLDGLNHTRVVSFGYQNVDFGQWSPSGAEIIVGAADGVYRVSADGGNLTKMGTVNLGGPVDGCCLSPAGDALYYIGGPDWKKKIQKVYFDPNTGKLADVPLGGGGVGGLRDTNDLSAAQFGDKVVLMSSFYWSNSSSLFGTGLFKKKKKRGGGLVVDAGLGTANLPEEPKLKGLSGIFGQGDSSGTGSAWRNIGQLDTTSYGISLNVTNDDTALGNVHVLYGSPDGQIYARKVEFNSPYKVADDFLPSDFVAGYPKASGVADVHHPKYSNEERTGLVFVAGRGTASRIYYWPNLNNSGSIRQLPLAAPNRGAEQPSVSRPR